MSPLEQRISNHADSALTRFAKTLANVTMKDAAMTGIVIAAGVAMFGIGQEVMGQSDLLAAHGHQALQAYKAALSAVPPKTMIGVIVDAFKFKNEAFGGNMQGIAYGLIPGAPLLATLAVGLARGFTSMKEAIGLKQQEELKANGVGQSAEPMTASLDKLGQTLAAYKANDFELAPAAPEQSKSFGMR